mgnify:CR=1 FL=1
MVVLVAALAAAGCDKQAAPDSQPQSSVTPAESTQKNEFNGTLDITNRGKAMPDFTVTDPSGKALKLTSHEFRLLSYLMHHMGEVVSRTELVEHLYDQDFDRDSNTIEVFVGRLRKKLGVEIIRTVRGLGYIAAPPEAPAKRG